MYYCVVEPEEQRAAFTALIAQTGHSLSVLSAVIGRNPAYLQQYLARGTPRTLAEDDRARLARFLGVPESHLGGKADPMVVSVPRIDICASAGLGNGAAEEAWREPGQFTPAMLRMLGVRPEAASMIRVRGDSMEPLLRDGDEILVDRTHRQMGTRGDVHVLRIEGELWVKRLRSAVGGVEVVSDNPAYPVRFMPRSAVEIIGKVVWLGRAL